MNARTNSSASACAIAMLARDSSRVTQPAGDDITSVAGVALHRRSAVASPMPCIDACGLAVVPQGAKQVMLREPAVLTAPIKPVRLSDKPALAPSIAPPVQRDSVIRLLTGVHSSAPTFRPHIDVGNAGDRVGDNSAALCSRDYAHLSGAPP